MLASASVVGCASRPAVVKPPIMVTDAQLHLSQINPDLVLPASPTTLPAPAPLSVLELYAAARSDLMQNQKADAAKKLVQAIELYPMTSVAFRDLGYALLGTDNAGAYSAYRSAVELDPTDLDSRIQLSRLLLIRNEPEFATEQLMLARLSPQYTSSPVDAAAIDMLLGRVLSERGYTRAALECFQRVVPLVERGAMEIRSRPELLELVAQPAIIKLRIADLAVQIGEFDQALALYQQIAKDAPDAAAGMELRIIQALAKKGDIHSAATQMLGLVDRFQASRSSIQPYIDLFHDRGGDQAALDMLRRVGSDANANLASLQARHVLEARLLRRLNQPKAAAALLTNASKIAPTVAAVREAVMSLEESDRAEDAPLWLMRQMIDYPDAMPAIWRGWSMLINPAQPMPVTVSSLAKMQVPTQLEPARQFALYRLASSRGQPVTAREALSKSNASSPAMVRQWATARMFEGPPDVDFTSEEDVVAYVEEFENDPQYLSASIGYLITQKRDKFVLPALETVADRKPTKLGVLAPLVELLRDADRRPEAINRIDRAAALVKSAPELYQLASLLSMLDETTGAEKMLRRAHQVDPTHAATCNDLGYMLADTGRELDFAENLLYRAVGAEPDNPAYIDSLGWLLYKRGKFADARKYLEQALAASDPADPVVLDHAGDAAYRTGDPDRAKGYWSLAMNQMIERSLNANPQLRLKIEQKLKQVNDGLPVDVAPIGQ